MSWNSRQMRIHTWKIRCKPLSYRSELVCKIHVILAKQYRNQLQTDRAKNSFRTRLFFKRIMTVVKLVGKRKPSYKDKNNEAAYYSNDSKLYHGNLLKIMVLLNKYEPIICEYFNITRTKKWMREKKNLKGRGNFVTVLSKYTIQLVINAISFNIKNTIVSEVQKAPFFLFFLILLSMFLC